MKFRYALVALALACNGDTSDKTGVTGETGDDTGTTEPGDCPDGQYTGPVSITDASVTCTGTSATFHATTEGVAAGGSIFAQETGSEYAGGQWSENHPLAQTAADECGFSSEMAGTVTASLWDCAQLEDNAFMSFAFFALDGTGAVADCYAFGGDVPAMTGGTATLLGQEPDYPTELAACEEGVEGM
jgi:hypothetical protein